MQVELLGGFSVTDADRRLDLGPRKQRLLLAVLLAARGEPVNSEVLVDALWGEHVPTSTAANLRQYLYRLRSVVGADRIVRLGRGFRLRLDGLSVDAYRFTELARAGEDALADGRTAVARDDFGQALRLWHGAPYADLTSEPALATEVAALNERHLTVLQRRIDVDLQLGRHGEVVPEVTALVAAHPYHEAFHARLMLALYRGGRTADALDVFAQARRILADELGLDPGRELRDLEQSILRQHESLRLPEPPIGARAPASRGPAELPAAAIDFLGREAETTLLDGLADEHAVAVVGPSGVGKTALVVRWGHAVADRFPDGQLFVSLHGFSTTRATEPIEALTQMLRALGEPAEQIPTDVDEAAARYRSLLAGKRVLVVLDNAGSPGQVRMLLPGQPGSLAVITSRSRLSGLVAESVSRVELAPLGAEPAVELLRRMLTAPRVAAEPVAVAALVEACGHLPLALRVAAADLADHPGRRIGDYLSELGADRIRSALADSDSGLAGRPMFDSSYAGLDETTQLVFRRLSLLPGACFTAETTAAVSGVPVPTAAAALTRLTDAHLVVNLVPGRYAFHDLVGEYAALRHGPSGPDDLDGLYAHYIHRCLAAAEAAYPQVARLPGPAATTAFADAAEARDWLAAELRNIVTVVQRSGTHPAAWRISDALRGYFEQRRNLVDWQTMATTARAAAEIVGDTNGVVSALISLGQLHHTTRDDAGAVRYWTTALAHSRDGDWTLGEATVRECLGTVDADRGRLSDAVGHFTAALELYRAAGFRPGELRTSGHLVLAESRLGLLAPR